MDDIVDEKYTSTRGEKRSDLKGVKALSLKEITLPWNIKSCFSIETKARLGHKMLEQR